MRHLLVAVAIAVVFLAGSCTQRTCPTYTKGANDIPQEQQQILKDQEDNV